ncbi:hypothetical protein NMG60_11011721 [Bertholletia excelsa]
MNGALILSFLIRINTNPLKRFLILLPVRTHMTASAFELTEIALEQPLTSVQCGTMLQSLTNTRSFQRGQKLHGLMVTYGIVRENTYLNTKLTAFYAGCGHMDKAFLIFDQIVLKNSFLWNIMIRGYASSNGCPMKALLLYWEMMNFGKRPDKFTYPFVLKACGDLGLVEIGRRIHCKVIVSGFDLDIYVGNFLIAMYSKFEEVDMMKKVFDRMLERDLTSWNTMISGYVKNGNPREALAIYQMMRKAGFVVDSTTLLCLLSAATDLAALQLGKSIHAYIVRKNFGCCNSFLVNCMIEMYCNCNYLDAARPLFNQIKQKDTVSWNSLISGYLKNVDAFESLRLFGQMVLDGVKPDQVTLVAVLGACAQITALQFCKSVHLCIIKQGFSANLMVGTALVDTYSKCGSLACSQQVFDEIPDKNLISWSALIAGYGAHGKGRKAFSVFNDMIVNGISPDAGVFVAVLTACSHAGLVEEGKQIFYSMKDKYNLQPGLAHHSCLVGLLGRAGHLDEAYEFIKAMEIDPTSDIWTALLFACRLHQNVDLAEIAAKEVVEMNPKGVSSYVCLSNIYAAEKRWDDVERVRALARQKGLKKPPGFSFVELDKVVHRFFVGDKSHEQKDAIYAMLGELRQQLKKAGYKPDTSSVLYDVEEEIKEDMLWDHSERLAIAFALINTGPGTVIRISKNLRVCRDCHTVSKLITKLKSREIIMRDIRRFHHFRDGTCSCGDFW